MSCVCVYVCGGRGGGGGVERPLSAYGCFVLRLVLSCQLNLSSPLLTVWCLLGKVSLLRGFLHFIVLVSVVFHLGSFSISSLHGEGWAVVFFWPFITSFLLTLILYDFHHAWLSGSFASKISSPSN